MSTFAYTRRADGQVLTETESVRQPDGSTVSGTAAYAYDALNRLTAESFDGPVGTDYAKAYALDLVGNRTKLVDAKEGQAAVTTTSIYNSRDQLLTEATGSATIVSGYDANGSLTSQSGGAASRTQSWDARGRLAGATVGGVVTSYLYTPDGIRASVTENGVRVDYVIDGMTPSGYAQVVEESASGVLAVRYTYGAGLDPVGETRGGVTSLYLADGHSGVRQAVTLAGAVVLAQRFDAFGATVAKAGTLATPIGYRGERFDATLGQYSLRARLYDPRQGRFTGVDPFAGNMGDPSQAMRYGYAGANPVSRMDPSGLEFSVSEMLSSMGVRVGMVALHVGLPWIRGEFGNPRDRKP